MISWRIKKIKLKSNTHFDAMYKNHHIKISWNMEIGEWNIFVNPNDKNEPIAYVGSWGNKNYDIDDAIYEAMRGSGLI